MKITLKKFSFNAALSKETYCFSADLYIDGKKRGNVSNRGHGGPTEFSDREAEAELDAYGAGLPREPEFNLVKTGELLVDVEVSRMLQEKEEKKMCKKGITFTDPAKPRNYSTYEIPYTQKNADWVRAKHPGVNIINEQFGKPLK